MNVIRIKRGENILSKNITLMAGELALDTVSGVLYTSLTDNGNPVEIKGAASGTVTKAETADYATKLATAQLIKLTGDVTGEASFDGSKAAEITATLKNIVTGATVNGITFNAKGLITGAEEVVYEVEDINGLTEALAGKVDKVEGKSLIADTEIARLANVTNYNDTAVKGLISQNATDIENIETAIAEIDIPEKTSELINDSGFITNIPEEYKTKTENDEYYQPIGNYPTKEEIDKQGFLGIGALKFEEPTEIFFPYNYWIYNGESGNPDFSEVISNNEPLEIIWDGTSYIMERNPNGEWGNLEEYPCYLSLGSERIYTNDSSKYHKVIVKDIRGKVIIGKLLSSNYIDLPTIPTKTSELTNDNGFITMSQVEAKNYITADGIPADYVTETELAGKGYLVANDIAGKADKTEVYTITQIDSKVTTINDAINTKATKADTLTGYGITDAYTKTEIDAKIAGAFKFKGEAESYDTLPTGAAEGDVYQVGDKEYAWDGDSWVELGFNIDLTSYATKTEVSNNYATKTALSEGLAAKANSADVYVKDDVYTKTEADAAFMTNAEVEAKGYATTSAMNTALEEKADKGTTLAAYGITDAYTKTEADTAFMNSAEVESAITAKGYATTTAMNAALSSKANSADVYTKTVADSTFLKEIPTEYITETELSTELESYAEKATTLAGYGITDGLSTTSVIDGGTF